MAEPNDDIKMLWAELTVALHTAERNNLPTVALQISKAIDALVVANSERSGHED